MSSKKLKQPHKRTQLIYNYGTHNYVVLSSIRKKGHLERGDIKEGQQAQKIMKIFNEPSRIALITRSMIYFHRQSLRYVHFPSMSVLEHRNGFELYCWFNLNEITRPSVTTFSTTTGPNSNQNSAVTALYRIWRCIALSRPNLDLAQ